MTDTIETDMSDLGDGGRIVSYYCSLVMNSNQNTLEDLIVPFYYENVYPCSENAAVGRDFVADALLTRAKKDFLPDASKCTTPQLLWFGRVSSLPEDEVMTTSSDSGSGGGGGLACSVLKTNEYNDQMQELIANGADPMQEVQECCVVVHGSMTFTNLSSLEVEDEKFMYQWVADQLNDAGSSTENGADGLTFPYRTHYLGAILETPSVEDNLPPAININDGNNNNNNFTDVTTSSNDNEDNDNNNGNNGNGSNPPPPPLPDSSLTDVKQPTATSSQVDDNDAPKQFTWLGVLIAIGLVFALFAVIYLVYKRRRHYAKGLKVQAAAAGVDSSEASSSPGSGSFNKEQPLVVTKSRGGTARGGTARGTTGVEDTMSVKEDYYDDLGLHVTIVPTHTNSTQSGSLQHAQQQHYHHHRSHDDDDEYNDEEDGGFVEMLHDDDLNVESNLDDDAPFQVSVLSDTANMKIQSVASNSYHTNQEEDDFFVARSGGNSHLFHHHNKTGGNHHAGGGGATQTTGSTSSGTYQFDLADANRNAIMGTYMGGGAAAAVGPITMTVVPPYPMEETSDSDIDSWAQTEGTVGSLEDRYEETGEI